MAYAGSKCILGLVSNVYNTRLASFLHLGHNEVFHASLLSAITDNGTPLSCARLANGIHYWKQSPSLFVIHSFFKTKVIAFLC